MYQQKMCYIDMYKNGLKCGNMGHVRMEWVDSQYRFQTNLCRLDRQTLVSAMIRRHHIENDEKLYDIEVIHGKGHHQSDWIPMWGDEAQLVFEASGGVVGVCTLPDMQYGKVEESHGKREESVVNAPDIAGTEPKIKAVDKAKTESTSEIQVADEKENMQEAENIHQVEEKRDMLAEIRKEREALSSMPLMDNKWKQLCSMYERVRPVAGDMEFIKIKPEDFIILRQEYQGLVRNSFLLHGYYNYHYILLGKYPDKYYLGVPGIMHEQERLAAAMFGFIGFERAVNLSENKDGDADFGYYMMEVAI